MAQKLTNETFDGAVFQSALPVLVDFYRDGCLPCRRIAPLLSRAEEQYGKFLSFAKVNTEVSADLAQRFSVTAAPTLILFQNGEEAGRKTGTVSFEELKLFIENIL